MRVVVKYDRALVDDQGQVRGHDAGATLVRRLLRVFPGAQLIGNRPVLTAGVETIPLEFVDAESSVLINMDVIDSVAVWRVLRARCEKPRIMNFAWWNTSDFENTIERSELALSCALFPTFANSERTATALRDSIKRFVVTSLAEKSRVAWVNLGIRLEHALPRQEPETPVVLYPAIYTSPVKQPRVFIDIVRKVARATPIRVEARLVSPDIISDVAMDLSRERWAKVSPLLPGRHEYWQALSRTTAFLATAKEESYGLEYIEALVAGAIGVFPDTHWAHAILPEGYPFFYQTPAQAEQLLLRAVKDRDGCWAELDAVAGGSFRDWLADHHSDDAFEEAITKRVAEWFSDAK